MDCDTEAEVGQQDSKMKTCEQKQTEPRWPDYQVSLFLPLSFCQLWRPLVLNGGTQLLLMGDLLEGRFFDSTLDWTWLLKMTVREVRMNIYEVIFCSVFEIKMSNFNSIFKIKIGRGIFHFYDYISRNFGKEKKRTKIIKKDVAYK